MARNVLNTPLKPCGKEPMTGFYRNGCCDTGPEDQGLHLVCTQVSDAFLAFSREQGNDLSTPRPHLHFPGLKAGDRWCVCVERWKEAMDAGAAAPIVLEATHISTLEFVSLEQLMQHAVDRERA